MYIVLWQNGHWEILEDGKQVPNTDTARQFSTLVLGTDCGFKHDVKLRKLQLKAFHIWQRFNEQTQQPWRTGSAFLVYQFCGHLYEVADSWGKQCITIKCNNCAWSINCLLKRLMKCIAADIKGCVSNQTLCFRQKKGIFLSRCYFNSAQLTKIFVIGLSFS